MIVRSSFLVLSSISGRVLSHFLDYFIGCDFTRFQSTGSCDATSFISMLWGVACECPARGFVAGVRRKCDRTPKRGKGEGGMSKGGGCLRVILKEYQQLKDLAWQGVGSFLTERCKEVEELVRSHRGFG
jgi:hypothetical protein